MRDLSKEHYQRIAFNLVTAPHQKARRRVMQQKIGPEQLPGLAQEELERLGFPASVGEEIRHRYMELAEAEVWRAKRHQIEILFREDRFYPELLGHIFDAPDFIYALGDLGVLLLEKIAIVGSRQATPYGLGCLNRMIPDLSRAELAIVSGMAYGIDSMAHQLTIKAGGKTIGVNAGGLLHLYPQGNRGLIQQIVQQGCVISEFSLETVPRPFYFPIRNRIIAGVSRSILVIEAAMRSGSLITARLGLEQNRDIFAVPGRIDSPVSQGTNYLIQQGAKLITGAADILIEYGITLPEQEKGEAVALSATEKKVLALMADGEIRSVDNMVDSLEESVSAVISLLMGLVLKGVVREEGGGYRRVGG